MGDICGDKIEFGGTKQKLLNAIFSTLCDAYLDRFIIAANNSMKLKLFEGNKAQPVNPLYFTLTALIGRKDVNKIPPINIEEFLTDSAAFE